MNKKSYLYIIFIIIGMALLQCTETKELSPDEQGTNYYPLQTGTYSIYQVYGTRYTSFEDSIEFSYWLKESVIDSFQNLENGISYKILRQKKLNENDVWVTDSIWTVRKYQQYAVIVENDIPVVNLTFPIKENKIWDGNKLNNKGEDEFEMININQAYSDAFGEYPKTVTVVREDLSDIIVKSVYLGEIYAVGRGLVYKEISILNYKQGDYLGLEVIESGMKYFQHLTEYGEE